MNYKLQSGDQVSIITSENAKPTANWLDYATTGRARSKIKSSLKDDKKSIAEDGKEILRRKLKQIKINLDERSINELVSYFNLQTSLDLFYRIGIGSIDNGMLKKYAASRSNVLVSFFKNKITRKKNVDPETINNDEITSKYDMLVFGKEQEKLNYKLSICCNPIPGDKVFGFLTIKDGIKVHKKTCTNALSLQSNYAYRIIDAKWIDSSQQVFKAVIKLTGIDQKGMVSDITKLISGNMSINIRSIKFDTDSGTFNGEIAIEVNNNNFVTKLMNRIKKINGIEKVSRV